MTEHATTPKPLHRSRSDRYVAGVCGGLAEYFGLHPAFFRVGFVVLTLLGGSGLLAYLAALLVIPDEGQTDSIAGEALRSRRNRPWAAIGLGLIAVAGLVLLSHATVWPHGDGLWVLLLVAGIVLLWSQRRDRLDPPSTPAPTSPVDTTPDAAPTQVRTPRRPGLGLPALGVLIAATGVLGLLEVAGVDVPWDVAIALGAILAGVAATVGAILRFRVGGVVALGLVLGTLAVAVATADVQLDKGIGDRTYHPTTIADLQADYRLGIGDLKIDLGDLQVPPGITRIRASLGVGHLQITVPRDVTLRIDGDVRWGDSRVLGANREDALVEVPDSNRVLLVEAEVRTGKLDVTRALR